MEEGEQLATKVPGSFDTLLKLSQRAAERAWGNLGAFVTAQAFIFASWGAMLNATSVGGRAIAMVSMSLVGAFTGLLWALLLTRMWDYHILHEEPMRRMARDKAYSGGDPGTDLSIARDVDNTIHAEWRYTQKEGEGFWSEKIRRAYWGFIAMSGNHILLFLTPVLFSAVHMVMLGVVSRCGIDKDVPNVCASFCYSGEYCRVDGFAVAVAVYLGLLALVCVQCLPRLLRKVMD